MKAINYQQIAHISEEECIGCTKCIQVCPVDAIIGANKQMHTVISEVCTGCELCLQPCPVDCIQMVSSEKAPENLPSFIELTEHRMKQHENRRHIQEQQQPENHLHQHFQQQTLAEKQAAIQAAVARVQTRKK